MADTGTDLLTQIFEAQTRLNDLTFQKSKIEEIPGRTLTVAAITQAFRDDKTGPNDLPNRWLNNYLTALDDESRELRKELLWKWWSKDRIDRDRVRAEIVDQLHFLVSLALCAGFDARSFADAYLNKNKINEKRQEGGYSKQNKVADESGPLAEKKE
ncbi:MAG TPA: dUTPase [Planctomycetota bacterium]|nr:dUTPase [Planctomycetota bacterium]